MQVNSLWQQHIAKHEASGLNDLRRQSILDIGIVMLLLAWVIMLGSIGYQGQLEGLWVALCLLLGAVGIVALRQRHFHIALVLFIAASLGAIVFQKYFFPDSASQFYFPVVGVAASLLFASSWSVFVVATFASLACIGVARYQGADWLDYSEIVLPVFLNYLTAVAAWLAARQMHIALAWTQNSYTEASDLLNQLRDERLRLASTLKMLEEAYYRITRLNQALIEARSAAETARRLKAEFAANVSHELRTPLNLIIGFSETMANAPETYKNVTWSPTLRGDVEQIYRSSRHLSSLIDDILDLSALEAQQLGLAVEETSLAEVVEEAAAVVRDLYRAKRLYLKIETAPDLPRLRMDGTRIRQVLLNLLTNAIRFTREGGVTITARLVGEAIQIAVADTGIGIAAQDVAKVFEVFGQVDGAISRAHEGTGLGVPLSKRLVELHGGRLWLESQPGRGTTFYFTLPLQPAFKMDRRHLPAQPPVPPPTYRDALLVVEPDPLLLRTLRRQLSAYAVIEVDPGVDLTRLIDQHQPVAVLMDTQSWPALPDQPEWITGLPDDLPLITLSLPGSLKSARALGIANYLIKPVAREQLLDAITALNRAIRTILITDDDPQLVDLLSRMLQSFGPGYTLLKAHSGEEALAGLRRQPVDLLLLDLVMPGLGGMGVLKVMKEDQALAGIPVIVISAQNPDEAGPQLGLFLQATRPAKTSLTESFNSLRVLLEGLPRPAPRRLPASPPAALPALPTVPADLPVS